MTKDKQSNLRKMEKAYVDKRRPITRDKWLEAGINYLKVACVYMNDSSRLQLAWGWIIVLFNLSSILALSVSFYYFIYDMDKLANIVHHWILMIDVVLLVYNGWANRVYVESLVQEMRTTFAYGTWFPKKEAEKVQMQRVGWNKTAIYGFWGITAYTMFNIVLLGIMEKYMEGSEVFLLFPCWSPFSLKNAAYFLFLAWELICIQTAVFGIFGALASQFYVYSYIYAELKILLAALNYLKTVNKEEHDVTQAVTQCAIHHQFIIKSFDKAQKLLGLVNLFILTSGVAVMTVSGFALISDNASVKIKFSGIMVTELVFLYISCLMSQNISDASAHVRIACYDTEWMCMNKTSTKSLQIMVERAFRPLSFTAMTGHKLSLDMYMNMVKAAYSYFNMLLTSK